MTKRKDFDIKKALGELVKDGSLTINLEPNQEPTFSFTTEGRKKTDDMLRTDPKAQLFYLQLHHNSLVMKWEDKKTIRLIDLITDAYTTARKYHQATGVYIDELIPKDKP